MFDSLPVRERDVESQYDYFGARYYDSRIGRWLAVDPLAGLSPGFSPYLYVRNDPLRFVDPTGKRDTTLDGKKAPNVMPEVEVTAERQSEADNEPVPAHSPNRLRLFPTSDPGPQKLVEAAAKVAKIAAYSEVRMGKWKSSKNGRWYSTKKNPNGTTGSRKPALARAKILGYISIAADFITLADFAEEMDVARQSGSQAEIARASADFFAACAGAFGGYAGFAYAFSYFQTMEILDNVIPYESPDVQDQIRCHGDYQLVPPGGPQ